MLKRSNDIAIRQARLRGTSQELFDIAVADGRIAAVAPRIAATAPVEIDARGGLATESFVNPHLHLCKVYTLAMLDDEAPRAYRRTSPRAGSGRTRAVRSRSRPATARRTCAR